MTPDNNHVKKKIKKRTTKISIIIIVCIMLISSCLIYLNSYYKAVDVDNYLLSNENVEVIENNEYIKFSKQGSEKCIIFYPGAKVDEKAYSPVMFMLANKGIDCYIMSMPFHMAIFNKNKADMIINENQYKSYYLSGHSMGGAMAASYVFSSENAINGLILLAAYSTNDLNFKNDLKVLSLYGENDKVLTMKKYEKYKKNLPSLQEIVIKGGNHGQFGSYGFQSGDGKATINKESQFDITVESIVNFVM